MKAIFRPLFLIFVVGVTQGALAVRANAEVIRSFHTEMRAAKDTSLDVTETLVMDFESAQRHGIYRFISTSSNPGMGRRSIDLKMLSVTDEKGKPYKFQQTVEGNEFKFKIGDPQVTLTGVHTYKLHFIVRGAVLVSAGTTKYYWDVTGDQWPFPIQNASARFYPPSGLPVSKLNAKSFYGPLGATTPAKFKREAKSVFFSIAPLEPGSGFTIAVNFPTVARPKATAR